MTEPFLGEIRAFACSFVPRGWAACAGQLVSIQQNSALFSILGTTYGGNGVQTFGLPDLRGRVPIHQGQGPGLSPQTLGQMQGTENHTLTIAQMPGHSHTPIAAAGATGAPLQTVANPTGQAFLGPSAPGPIYAAALTNAVPMAPSAIGVAGGSQSHTNVQPVLALQICIAVQGVFPSRN